MIADVNGSSDHEIFRAAHDDNVVHDVDYQSSRQFTILTIVRFIQGPAWEVVVRRNAHAIHYLSAPLMLSANPIAKSPMKASVPMASASNAPSKGETNFSPARKRQTAVAENALMPKSAHRHAAFPI